MTAAPADLNCEKETEKRAVDDGITPSANLLRRE